jgi:hypothetical protein
MEMSDLAYNINGEGFELPETATGWRVRRMKPRGAPEVVYGKDGLPLIIPIESDLEELRRSVDAAGRFRLDAVDDRGRNVDDVTAAYVVVPHKHEEVSTAVVETAASRGPINGVDAVIGEAMRLNTELAKSVIDRFPEMMQAAALLLRAADGAGLPAREPRADGDDDDGDDDGEPAIKPSFDLNALVAQVVPMLVMGLGNGKVKLPALNEVLDWRKAKPAKQSKPAPASEAAAADDAKPAPATDALPPLDPQTMQHFIAIQSALKPEEASMAREVASTLGPAELRAWFDELSKLTVPQAVQKIRVLVAGNTEAVS